MKIEKIAELLGPEKSYLEHRSKGIDKANLHLPGPDFVDGVRGRDIFRSFRSTRGSSTPRALRSRRIPRISIPKKSWSSLTRGVATPSPRRWGSWAPSPG